MKKTILIALFYFSTFVAFSQNNFSIQSGSGQPWFGIHLLNNDAHNSPRPAISMEVNYLRKLDRHIYAGAKLLVQRYSFVYSNFDDGASYQTSYQIDNKSNYLFFAPTIDIGLGRQQYIHCYLSIAMGAFLSGGESVDAVGNYNMGQATNYDTAYNSNKMMKKFITHGNFGLEEHYVINKKWHLLFNEGLSLFSTDIATLVFPSAELRPGYIVLQVGVMKLYQKPVKSIPAQ